MRLQSVAQLARAEAWGVKARAILAGGTADASAELKAARVLLREGDTIYAALDDLGRIAVRADELARRQPTTGEEEEDLPAEQNWAQCDSCQKWRRLGPQQVPITIVPSNKGKQRGARETRLYFQESRVS